MPNYLVSIVINNYNYEKYLSKAIDSALDQSYSMVEVIIVDDCSTDGSRHIIEDYSDRIIPVLHTTNGKQGAAFNSGFAKSSGDIVIFLDSDDYLYPDAVEKIVAAWKPGISKVHYRLDVVDVKGASRGYSFPPVTIPLSSGEVWRLLLKQGSYCCVATSGNAFSREALAKLIPIDLEYTTMADDYLQVLLPFYGDVIAIQEPLGAYRIHDKNQYAMATVNASRFHRIIQHDLRRCNLLTQWAKNLGHDIPDKLYTRSFGEVWTRLSSLRFDPQNHPVPSDTRLELTWLGLRALWQYSDFNLIKRVIFSLWFLWVGLLPRFLAKPAIVWLFAPHERPQAIGWFLNKLRKLTTYARPASTVGPNP